MPFYTQAYGRMGHAGARVAIHYDVLVIVVIY